VIEIFPPFRNRLKGAKIEPLIIPQEQLDEFKQYWQIPVGQTVANQ